MADILQLYISGLSPDPLNISSVSGFYGPGAWAAWFLSTIAAWHDLFRHPRSVRAYTTVPYLLGTNWAAIDVLRQFHKIRNLGVDASDPAFTSHQGALAAATTVTYWGTVTAIFQIIWLLQNTEHDEKVSRRWILLVTGTLLPSASLACLLSLIPPWWDDNEVFNADHFVNTFPAFYWKPMSPGLHYYNLQVVATLGLATITIALLVLLKAGMVFIPEHSRISGWRWFIAAVLDCSEGSLIIRAAVIGPTIYVTMYSSYLATYSVGRKIACVVFTYFHFPYMFFIGFLVTLIMYPLLVIFTATEDNALDVRKSCFFMPCAPQNIREWDQAFGLFAGLLLLAVELTGSIIFTGLLVRARVRRLRRTYHAV